MLYYHFAALFENSLTVDWASPIKKDDDELKLTWSDDEEKADDITEAQR